MEELKRNQVKSIDTDIDKINIDKYNVAMPEEQKFNIGDKVRYLINFNLFEKRSAPKWSHTVHNIMSTNNHSYVLDNGMVKKYYELQLIHDVQKPQKESVVPTLIKIAKENKSKRSFNKTGLDLSRIIKSKQRKRIPTDRLHY